MEILRSSGRLFPHTSKYLLGRFFLRHEQFEIHDGCGGRPCRMCLVNGKAGGTSLPAPLVTEMLALTDEHTRDVLPSKQVNLFYRGEPLYYQFDGATIADILAWGITNTQLSFYFRTHGFLYESDDQAVPLQAIEHLAVLLKDPVFAAQAKNRIAIGVSIDPWGPLHTHTDTDPSALEDHMARVRHNLTDLAAIRPVLNQLIFFYNPFDESGVASHRSVMAMADYVVPRKLKGLGSVCLPAYTNGKSRARLIRPKLAIHENTEAEPWEGYGTRVNGDVVYSDGEHAPMRIGSLYEPLPLHMP